MEAIRGRLKELEAGLESFCLYKVWGMKMFKGCKEILEVWTSWRPLEAVQEN